mmetsp:Transcript_32094/g.75002  ORF Transcript_32094/g.75002 Transcript_32094/m.75002 type:complete len:261 (-) Transcript_32094:725-1507(-)
MATSVCFSILSIREDKRNISSSDFCKRSRTLLRSLPTRSFSLPSPRSSCSSFKPCKPMPSPILMMPLPRRSMPFVSMTMSLFFATPFSWDMPCMNSERSSSPSPPVSSSEKSSMACSSFSPSIRNLSQIAGSLKASLNSARLTIPLPSSSISRNISSNSFISRSCSLFRRIAISFSSPFDMSMACWTITAVTKFRRTKDDIAVKSQRKIQIQGNSSTKASMMPCESSPCIKRVNVSMDALIPLNLSCASLAPSEASTGNC